MKEILFKAKRIDNGEWVEGSFIDSGNHEQVFIYPHYNGASTMPCRNLVYHRMIAVDVETICQYTGLTDKNGNKIWENDIVKAEVKQNSLCQSSLYSDFYQISYHEKYCYFYLKKKNNNLLFDGNWSYFLKSIEVIGNIFDNQELLKGE